MLVRFVAVSVIGLSFIWAGLYVADNLIHHLPIGPVHFAVLLLPLVLGIVLLAKSKAAAEWLANKLDL